MFSRYFIDRPIFAFVIGIFICLAGLAAMRSLPVAQYPEIAPPVVQVMAMYPGASSEVLEQTVAAPLENAITGVEGMMYMSSTSTSSGMTTIFITFEIGTDIDQAAVNVNNRVSKVEARLPEEVRRQGITVEKGSSSFLQVLAFYSPDGSRDDLWTSNYVTLNVLDRLKRIPGTTNVQIFGAKDYAMRIWLKPDQMSQLKVTVPEIAAALSEQNAQFAAGKIGATPTTAEAQELVYTVTAQGRFSTVEEFENVIIRANADGSTLRLKDIARVELGSRDYDFLGQYNGQSATLVGIFLQPGANALDVAAEVNATVAELKQRFPAGLDQATPYDTTRFVEVSIREVVKTLAEAMLLVFLVVYLFLQNWRATLIPILAVPISLLGTFAGLYMLGYSINTLTLFGMVLSIGIVVDDAIVVLENVERIMHEEHLSARDAAIKAMQEVSGPVVAIVMVLCAVFVPIAFLGGLTGELFRQFAVTISIAVSLSGVVALVMTPALCVAILRHEHKQTARFFLWFNGFFQRITGKYVATVGFFLRRGLLALLLVGGMIFITAGLWRATPGSLVPDEDQGFYIAAIFLPDGASLQRTQQVTEQVIAAIRSNPANKDIVSFSGFDFIGGGYKNSAATIFVTQQDWSERDVSASDLVNELFMKTATINEALVLAFNPPPIFGLGNTGGFEFYLQNRGDGGPEKLAEAMGIMQGAAAQSPILAGVQTLWRPNTPQLKVDLDRERARALGVPVNDAFNTLAGTLGTYYVNDFNKYGRAWQVLMSADAQYRMKPEDINHIYVKNSNGDMIPMSALANIEYSSGPDNMERYNNLPAVKLLGNAAAGYSSGQAIAEIERLANTVLPPDISYDWTGSAFQEKRSGGTTGLALGMAVVMVFLILAALYEKWSLPLSVLLAMPFGIFGALVAVWIAGLTNDVYFQIGLVTLLGLAAKNAILIVEYALMKTQQGWSTGTAALEAARLRFRPIIMTSLAFILGVVPLALSSGAGAGARHSVGTGVMGGMMAATFLAVFFVPLFFFWLTERRIGETRTKQQLAEEIAEQHRREHLDTKEGLL
ncbi:MAG: multidrug efflux RND transporter permease subunit [Gammaproteobacteria bacterium]|nr:multidrug efflux RND transporter permease subunit [Gammaproteobacteria bacterium]MBU1553426.1 multidrug efflux RND transporter permease subunit [Gammaproteobacteria bacterium]MBU2069758.1 multidrug efflux RND transporter permease subunit [Gammaproteobacteria bacterium]MBU2184623.1 multidrug efflux RND transporter permease subunit [Gammaproteobacteria bacterium]MBU2205711.1 multidrug efflux RND transporter permease subunit [Gammaproteobacteria bacterium]